MRASSLDRALSCPASQERPAIEIESADDGARLGTALHRIMVPIVLRQPELDVATIAQEAHVDAEEVSILRILGKRFWERYGSAFPNPVCEAELSEGGELWLSGHPDVMDCVDGQVRVLDWKTGRMESSHDEQMRAYAYLGMLKYEVTRAWVGVARVRDQELIPREYRFGELQAWYEGAVDRLQDLVFRPSIETCQYCPRRMECPARIQHLRDSLAIITDSSSSPNFNLNDVTDTQLRHGVTAARAIAKICDSYIDAAKVEVEIRGNVEGLTLKETERREIVAPLAWQAIEARIGLPVLLEAVKVSKTKVEDAIRATAERGQKKAEVDAFMEELDAAGAIVTKTSKRLECKPVPKPIEVQA